MWRSAVQICLGLHIGVANVHSKFNFDTFSMISQTGGLAQLARAPALQAGGQRFESVILHSKGKGWYEVFYFFTILPLKDL